MKERLVTLKTKNMLSNDLAMASCKKVTHILCTSVIVFAHIYPHYGLTKILCLETSQEAWKSAGQQGRAESASRWSGVAWQNTGTCRFPKRPERAPDGEGRLGALLVGPEWLEKNLVS